MLEEPPNDHDVPTLVKNPRWLGMVEPVFSFMGTVPGYKEYDVSFWFLMSLSVFFAMLVGDGGYGLLFLVGTMLARRRFKSAASQPFSLLYVFSAATVLWGLITGNWFGVAHLSEFPLLSRFVVPALNSYSQDQNFMIQLCFTLGAVHLSIAHIIRGLRFIGTVRALGELGWICILWFLYYAAGHLVLGKPLPGFGLYLVLAGFLLTSLFTNPKRSFVKASLLTMADLPLSIIRSFSDLVSYLRLFAVGYATFVVAMSFNEMAASLEGNPFLSVAGAALIVVLGHGINIAMAAMAVLVHGIRLNVLEFSTHLEMTWSGRKYAPFRKR
jgi:V/A-type H+-transporting ATPase subunit I